MGIVLCYGSVEALSKDSPRFIRHGVASLGEKKSYGVHETLSKGTPRFIRHGVASHGGNKSYGVHETLSNDAPHFIRHGVASLGEKKSYGEHETLSKNAQMGLASLRRFLASLGQNWTKTTWCAQRHTEFTFLAE